MIEFNIKRLFEKAQKRENRQEKLLAKTQTALRQTLVQYDKVVEQNRQLQSELNKCKALLKSLREIRKTLSRGEYD